MTSASPALVSPPTLSRSGEQIVAALRELEEGRIIGLVNEWDYDVQRAQKFDALLRPMRGLWFADLFGTALVGAPLGALIWFLTRQPYYTAAIAAIGGTWGFTALGRILREKFADLRSRGRRKILVALLENDLLTAGKFAEYEERLLPRQRKAS